MAATTTSIQQASSASRTLVGYLVLPRVGDTVKWLILPTAFLVGCVLRGFPEPHDLVKAGVVWLALELLVYQARYQWNDIRGFEADQHHPEGDRGRLPGPWERRRSHITWSAATAVAKVVSAVAVCWLVDAATARLMTLLSVAVFGLAAVYESLRKQCTGRTGQVPAPLTPGVVSIWVVVGAGYALRALTGLRLAVDLTAPPLLLVVAAATCWAFGVGWITSRWALEATAFAGSDGGRLRWRSSSADEREHQLALVRWLPASMPSELPHPRRWPAVRDCSQPSAPWNAAGILAAGLAAVAGPLLTDPHAPTERLVVCLVIGAVAGVVVTMAGARRGAALALMAVLVAAGFVAAGVTDGAAAGLPWLVVSAAQLCYLRQDRASLGRFLRRTR